MKVAITGTIGSGKSEVSNYLRSKGYYVFDADKCNRELLNKGNLGYLEVKKAFPDVFDNDVLNKPKLALKVFNSKENLAVLESIMHPLILDLMNKEAKKHDIFFAEIPLLFEKNWDCHFDHNLLVVSSDDIILKRLKAKGLNEIDINNRIKSQFSTDMKIKRAEEIIYNNSSFSDLYRDIDNWLLKIC